MIPCVASADERLCVVFTLASPSDYSKSLGTASSVLCALSFILLESSTFSCDLRAILVERGYICNMFRSIVAARGCFTNLDEPVHYFSQRRWRHGNDINIGRLIHYMTVCSAGMLPISRC